MQTAPVRPCSVSDIRQLKCSGGDEMPKGILWKQKRPKGVINVVSRVNCGASGICQNPELASSFEKILAPASCAKVWSTAGRTCHSLRMLWLSCVRSTQICTFLLLLGTTTIPAHHSVGSSTLAMTPSALIDGCHLGAASLSRTYSSVTLTESLLSLLGRHRVGQWDRGSFGLHPLSLMICRRFGSALFSHTCGRSHLWPGSAAGHGQVIYQEHMLSVSGCLGIVVLGFCLPLEGCLALCQVLACGLESTAPTGVSRWTPLPDLSKGCCCFMASACLALVTGFSSVRSASS